MARGDKAQARMREALKTAASQAPRGGRPDVMTSSKGMTLVVAADIRPDLISYKAWTGTKDPAVLESQFDDMDASGLGWTTPYLRCVFRKELGNKKFAAGKYEEAVSLYKHAMSALVGQGFELPTKVYHNEKYKEILKRTDSYKEVMDLAACATNIAQCYIKMDKIAQVWMVSLFVSPSRHNI